MTKKELAEVLKDLPDDTQILVEDYFHYWDIGLITLNKGRIIVAEEGYMLDEGAQELYRKEES